MAWFVVAIFSYFFSAAANVMDKFLLGSKRISSAPVYAFYVGIFSLASFFITPFNIREFYYGFIYGLKIKLTFGLSNVFQNLSVSSQDSIVICLVSGLVFAAGILLLFFAFERSEASRVAPVVGAIIPLATFVLAAALGVEKLFWTQILGLAFLIFGGLLISFDFPLKLGKQNFFSGFYYSIGAGFFIAVSYIMFKNISSHENFITWYVWTRAGCFIGACCLLLVPIWRKNIFRSFHSAKKDKKQAFSTGCIFMGNKIFGGVGTLMFNKALDIGSITLVNALVSVQYVFVLVIAAALSQTKAHIFQEKLSFWDWAQKILAIGVIAVGMFMIYE